jgi:hypothetical protein
MNERDRDPFSVFPREILESILILVCFDDQW